MADAKIQRENMVESQVRPSDVTDRRIIRAMLAVPRHLYVPVQRQAVAYMDGPVPLTTDAAGRSVRELLAPRLFAKMAQAADLPDTATVLVGGCGTGYGVAVLARVARKVIGIEPDASLADRARKTLTDEKVANASILTGAIETGSGPDAPFDAIILEGAVSELPRSLLDQLKDGGRMIAVVAGPRVGKVVVAKRSGATFDQREVFDATAALLPGFARKSAFTF